MSRIVFLGAGRMAGAIAGGMVTKGGFSSDEIAAFDVSRSAAEKFTELTGVRCVCEGAPALVSQADCVVLAVKPQYLANAVARLEGACAEKFILSIVAGVRIEQLEKLTGSRRVMRVMPNTPALIGEGMAALAGSLLLPDKDEALGMTIMQAVGKARLVPEKMIDGVTAVSGCGPAYVYDFIQALADGGVVQGLPRDLALELAVQTVIGSARMVAETKLHPAELRDQVTSPGGSTIAAVSVLEQKGFRGIVMSAVEAAAHRTAELGRKA